MSGRGDPKRAMLTGTTLLAALALGAGIVSLLGPDPLRTELGARLAGPSAAHWLGQDGLGRDVLARVAHGAGISALVAAAVVAICLVVGVTIGTTAALAGGWVDVVLSRMIDVVLAFPGLLLAIAITAVRGPGVGNVIVALSLLGWTGYARLARAEISRLRSADFATAARALGAGPIALAYRHLLPLAAPLLLVQATFAVSGAIVAEASLSFLGLGVPAPTPSWGAMLDEGRQFLLVAPHLVFAPGAVLAVTVLALQLLGDGLRDWLDVRTPPVGSAGRATR